MPLVVYPAELPAHTEWTVTTAERRAGEVMKPGSNVRARNRDHVQTARASWIYTPENMTEWVPWRNTDLNMGLRWFSMPAYGRGGRIDRVVRYLMQTMREDFISSGIWKVSCDMEVRGLSEPPQAYIVSGLVSATVDGIGAVRDGDIVVLFAVCGADPIVTPSGWTKHSQQGDSNGHIYHTFTSIYSPSNAVANTTNFPTGGGWFATIVYRGPSAFVVHGTLGDSATTGVSAPALTNPTGASSFLLAMSSSRNAAVSEVSTEGMTQILEIPSVNFHATIWVQEGVQTGARSFVRSATGFNYAATIVEIA